MRALWAPLEVDDFDAAARFYGDLLGLRRMDTWQRTDERGAVFAVGDSGRIEVVATTAPQSPPPTALELPTWTEVDALHRRLTAGAPFARQVPGPDPAEEASAGRLRRSSAPPARPRIFPRGHYGFVAHDPDGNPLLIWSER